MDWLHYQWLCGIEWLLGSMVLGPRGRSFVEKVEAQAVL
jgi:hypothetical protein